MRTFCFKLYQSRHNAKLHAQINAAGLTFNHCIALHRRYYKIFGKYLNQNKLKKHLTKLKKIPKFKYLLEYGAQAVQNVVERIDRAFELFFRNVKRKTRCSPPKFKKVKGSNNRRRAKMELARLYRKTFNQRHDFHFKLVWTQDRRFGFQRVHEYFEV